MAEVEDIAGQAMSASESFTDQSSSDVHIDWDEEEEDDDEVPAPPLSPKPEVPKNGSDVARRQQAMKLVKWYFRLLFRQQPAVRTYSKRVQCQAAFDLIEGAGERFWGVSALWSRRRSAVDSFLLYHYDSFMAELAS